MERNMIVVLVAVILLFVLALIYSLGVDNRQPVACTMEALICPDGSAVGRIAPDCRFAPCPNCTCPVGYIQEGSTCNPACYYSTPKCLAPSIECDTTET